MPIPDFDHNNVLPPHVGSPTNRDHLSPYPCSSMEFCSHFATSAKRIEILKGYVTFRMNSNGITSGFQWIDGSFTENIEMSEKRAPNDMDLVTFYGGLSADQLDNLKVSFREFVLPSLSKTIYMLDHYAIDIAYSPLVTVEQTRYWLQLFTHNRNKVWKGILQIPLNTPHEDQQALDYLNSL